MEQKYAFFLSYPVNRLMSHDPSWVTTGLGTTDMKHHTSRPGGHSLVTPGRDSQYEGEEEDGAYDGPDDDVGTGDTWDRGGEESGEANVC